MVADIEDEEADFIKDDDVAYIIDDQHMDHIDSDHDDDDGDSEGDESPTTTAVLRFARHKGSVFTVSTHPLAPLAVSGGEDDMGYVWDVTSGRVVATLTGHTDSVTSAAFSADGELVATGGMDGKIRVWRRRTGAATGDEWSTWEFLTQLEGPDEPLWLRWHPRGTVLLAGSNDKTVWLWQLPGGNVICVFAGHTGAVNCGDFTPDGKRIVTACSDNNLIYWDPRTASPLFRLTAEDARFDLGGITSLAVNPSSTIVVVAGESGGVRVVSLSKGEVVGSLSAHTEGESVEAVQFVDTGAAGLASDMVATGGTDGKVCVWDLHTMRLRTTYEHQGAVTALLTHPAPRTHLITSASVDRTLRTWDTRTGSLIREHLGHKGPVFAAALGLEGSVVASAGDDGVCLIFRAEEYDLYPEQ
jgi:ribosome assembly protein SQT1